MSKGGRGEEKSLCTVQNNNNKRIKSNTRRVLPSAGFVTFIEPHLHALLSSVALIAPRQPWHGLTGRGYWDALDVAQGSGDNNDCLVHSTRRGYEPCQQCIRREAAGLGVPISRINNQSKAGPTARPQVIIGCLPVDQNQIEKFLRYPKKYF